MAMLNNTMKHRTPHMFGCAPLGIECRYRSAAYAVIRADGQVATISTGIRGAEKLWLPGGGMHGNESPSQTIIREVQEELGRQVTLLHKLGEAIQFFHSSDEDCWYRMKAHFFAAQFKTGVPLTAEHALHWVNPAECKSDFFHECHAWATEQ